jgi:4,5-DOPA dioxygenase extradiol
MARPRTIHDFFGFPRPLFDIQYPAPGLPELAEEVAEVARPDHVGADHDGWGLDHGTWSVLLHAFPGADVPVVQLSIDLRRPPEWHVALGARLAALRERGVLLMGSGNVVHNLRAIDWQREDHGFDWAHRLDEHARQLLAERPGDAAALVEHPDYAMAAPTAEHFLPVLYIAGFAAATGQPMDVPIDGYAYGSLSMTCHTVGVPCPQTAEGLPGAAPLGTAVPAEDSNL